MAVVYLYAGKLISTAWSLIDEALKKYSRLVADLGNPQRILWTACRIQHALGHEDETIRLLEQAYREVKTRASAIPDRVSLSTFYNLKLKRGIVAAYEASNVQK